MSTTYDDDKLKEIRHNFLKDNRPEWLALLRREKRLDEHPQAKADGCRVKGGVILGHGVSKFTPFQTKPDAPPARLIVRRVKPTPGSQLALFARYSYHAFITDRDGEPLELEADHRRHAEIENAIRDLKYGVGLNHLPSGRFAANGAWLVVQVMAHNLARWTARIGLGERTVITKTLRRRVFALVGRITRSARRLTLHLPRRWPWETQFSRALARLQAIPLPA